MKMTMYIADRQLNGIMEVVGMKGKHKEFVVPATATFHGDPTEAYFQNILTKGRSLDKRFWIVAVEFAGEWFIADGVKCLSDGSNEAWFKNKTLYDDKETNCDKTY